MRIYCYCLRTVLSAQQSTIYRTFIKKYIGLNINKCEIMITNIRLNMPKEKIYKCENNRKKIQKKEYKVRFIVLYIRKVQYIVL